MKAPKGSIAADIVIMGGDFSCALCTLHLAATQPRRWISIAERRARLGPGVAYGACSPKRALNVRSVAWGSVSNLRSKPARDGVDPRWVPPHSWRLTVTVVDNPGRRRSRPDW